MIRFNCPGCARPFNVPDHFAGKRARCKNCGGDIMVPPTSLAPTPEAIAPAATRLPVRTRRLIADLAQMRETFTDASIIRLLQTSGDPAEVYNVEFNIRGIESIKSKQPVFREQHVAEIRMTHDYPRIAPACRMITPIFHPNIDESSICVGDHWTAGERLTDLVIRIGEMIAFQAYNIKSPLNGEAAMWADLNPDELPIDKRNLHPPILEQTR